MKHSSLLSLLVFVAFSIGCQRPAISQSKKYFPANASYLDYAMRDLEAEMQRLNETGNYLSKRLRILLRYIYAGKEKEGWTFFDSAYRLPDRDEIKARIKAVLDEEPTYNYLKPEIRLSTALPSPPSSSRVRAL